MNHRYYFKTVSNLLKFLETRPQGDLELLLHLPAGETDTVYLERLLDTIEKLPPDLRQWIENKLESGTLEVKPETIGNTLVEGIDLAVDENESLD